MKKFLLENRWQLIVYLIMLIAGGIILLSWPKTTIHLFFNQWHSPFFNFLFKYMTYIASWGVILIFLLLLLVKVRYAWMYLIGSFFIAIIVQGLKRLAFPHVLRPEAYFKSIHKLSELYLVPGEHMHLYHSFPSGHAASAFGMLIILLYITRNQWLKWLWFIIAVLTAYSRIYLSQHFLLDVETGSIIGAITMLIVILLFEKYFPSQCDYSIRSRFCK